MREPQPKFAVKKRLITRRTKTRKIEIISRKTQPKISLVIPQMKEQAFKLGKVSSSWISQLGYDPLRKHANMILLATKTQPTKGYFVYIPFTLFEEWYHAHSKGTFFNEKIKGKFVVKRI